MNPMDRLLLARFESKLLASEIVVDTLASHARAGCPHALAELASRDPEMGRTILFELIMADLEALEDTTGDCDGRLGAHLAGSTRPPIGQRRASPGQPDLP